MVQVNWLGCQYHPTDKCSSLSSRIVNDGWQNLPKTCPILEASAPDTNTRRFPKSWEKTMTNQWLGVSTFYETTPWQTDLWTNEVSYWHVWVDLLNIWQGSLNDTVYWWYLDPYEYTHHCYRGAHIYVESHILSELFPLFVAGQFIYQGQS